MAGPVDGRGHRTPPGRRPVRRSLADRGLGGSETQRAQALAVWNIHYNYHRPHTALGARPPAATLGQTVTNVLASYN
ncbi:integrase core domain-containing protein [Streptomyces sp. NPDC055092]